MLSATSIWAAPCHPGAGQFYAAWLRSIDCQRNHRLPLWYLVAPRKLYNPGGLPRDGFSR